MNTIPIYLHRVNKKIIEKIYLKIALLWLLKVKYLINSNVYFWNKNNMN